MERGLKEFVELLESRGELIRIKEFVDPHLEVAEITDRFSKEPGGGKALLFENTGTSFPILTNMMGSIERLSLALRVNSLEEIPEKIERLFEEMMQERSSLREKLRLLPTLAEASRWLPTRKRGKAAVQEVVHLEPDLSMLPVITCWPEDGGPFITLPLVHTKDPKTGGRNVGMYRMQIFSKESTGMHWHRHKTGARHFNESKEEHFPIAVALGGDPIYTYAATAPLPDGIDEYLLAGFLRGKPVSLVNCITQPLQVPADCDIIIEGYIVKDDPFVVEGPFGDHTGFYSLADLYPKMKVTAITHRKEAIYPATLVGVPPQEDKYLAIATEKVFLSPIKLVMAPEVVDLHLPEEGCGHNLAFVKIEKSYPGQAIKVANALWGAGQMMFNKIMVLVDGEVDIRNYQEVWDAISSNYTPKFDTHFTVGPSDILDHAAPIMGFGGKVMFDATLKTEEELALQGQPEELTPQGLPEELALQEKKELLPLHFTHNREELKGKINVIIDRETEDPYLALWVWGANCDPMRDSEMVDGKVVMDATTKVEGERVREWPKVALSSLKTIKAVDEKWAQLGVGQLIKSPSLRFYLSKSKD